MIAALLGLPGKMKVLTDRLTSARATKLDNLNATVSSRAAASTALTNVVWSDARAAKLDTAALEASPLLSAPIVSGVVPQAPTAVTIASYTDVYTKNSGLEHLGVISTTYVNSVNYTGKGVLEFAAAQNETSAGTTTMQITIDGIVIIGPATVAGIGGGSANVAAMVGAINSSAFVSLSAIPFKTSLKIEIKVTSGSTGRSFIKYRKSA